MKRLVLATAMAAVLATPAVAADKTVALGYQIPLTGDKSQYGQVFRNSAQLVLEKYNADAPVKVVIKFEDSKDDAKEGRNIARKFADDKEIVGVLGDFSSTVSMAAGEVYAEAGVPQLSQTASHPDFVKLSKWQFRNITNQVQEGPFNADWILQSGPKSVAVIGLQNDWGISAVEQFTKAFEAKGGKIVASELFNPGTRDFRAILTKVARAKPEAIYVAMFYEEGANILQQRKQLGIEAPVFGTSSLYSPKLIELGGEAIDGLKLATTFVPDNPDPKVQEFVATYKARYNAEPNMFAAQAYDAVGIMLDAVRKAGPDVTRDGLRVTLAKTQNYPGVTGLTSFDPETREPSKQLARMKVEGGKFVVIR